MPEHGSAQVALFIDWDNLAISTAADHSGAMPDLRRIVGVAQGYGTLLVARAYAEWGVTSDRLAVYRAGVEPVYAPTFRFEPEAPGQSRGKSLADPCLVADCVDAMHLHPHLTHLVIVSGDKDLVPIVRLAQMRGKRVIVIGPDLVAAVLRDMADEYIPYRSLVGTTGAVSPIVRSEAADLRSRRRRRGGRGGIGRDALEPEAAAEAPPVEESRPDRSEASSEGARSAPRHERRERRPFQDRAGVFRPRADEPAEPNDQATEITGEVVESAPEPPPERPLRRPFGQRRPRFEPVAPAEERREEPSFEPPLSAPSPPPLPEVPPPAAAPAGSGDASELWGTIREILAERTNSGRPRLRATNLKDYLIARVPGFSESRYGFSRFRDLLGAAESSGVLVSTDVGPVQWIALPGLENVAPAAPTPVPAAAPPPPPSVAAIDTAEAVRAVVEMRHRTRLLTQGYVSSNLGALVAARAPGAAQDEAVRDLIDRLVDEGALRVDREPQEVDVNGSKHRLRLVHLVDDHALVRQAEEAHIRESGADLSAAPVPEGEQPAARGDGRRRGRRGSGSATAPDTSPTAAAEPARATESAAGGSASMSSRRRSRGGRSPASPDAALAHEPSAVEAAPNVPDNAGAADAGIERVYELLVEAVRGGIAPGRDTAGAAGVKSRLTAALGSFNERDFGFSKFKDFLQAAQRAGKVRVETAGAATRVGLP